MAICTTTRRREAELQAAIMLLLRLKYRAIVAVTDAGVLRKHGVHRRDSGIPAGWPDLTALLPGGRMMGIEVKRPGGRVSAEQLAMRAAWQGRDHEYIVARSVDDVIAAVEGGR